MTKSSQQRIRDALGYDRNINVLELTAQIVSAHVSNNPVPPDALPFLIQESTTPWPASASEPAQPERPQPAVSDQEIGVP